MKKGRLLYAMNNTLQNSLPTNIVIITSIKGAWIDSRRKSNLPWELKGSLHARYSQPLNTVLAGSIKALTLVLFVGPSKTTGCTLCETGCWTQGTAGLVGLILFLPPSLKRTERQVAMFWCMFAVVPHSVLSQLYYYIKHLKQILQHPAQAQAATFVLHPQANTCARIPSSSTREAGFSSQ